MNAIHSVPPLTLSLSFHAGVVTLASLPLAEESLVEPAPGSTAGLLLLLLLPPIRPAIEVGPPLPLPGFFTPPNKAAVAVQGRLRFGRQGFIMNVVVRKVDQ